MANSYPSPGDGLGKQLKYMWDELRRLADRIAMLARRVTALEEQHPHVAPQPQEEMPVHHQRGDVVVEESDPYPLLDGGTPLVAVQLRQAPSAPIVLEPRRNGLAIGQLTVAAGSTRAVRQFPTLYNPMDLYTIAVVDAGADGAGLVTTARFRRNP